jgi:phosphatidylserine/phosphatidylglycerophosphate/cardiolipin synthase-like enzyme
MPRPLVFLALVFSFAAGTASCQARTIPTPHIETTAAPTELQSHAIGAGFGAFSPSFEIYFTNPDSPLASQRTGGIESALADSIGRAVLTVDMAAYRLDSPAILVALLRAKDRGVRVRVVAETDEMQSSDLRALVQSGAMVTSDRLDGLMHDKFVVVDGVEVWTGSMNFTESGIYDDHNTLVRIKAAEVAELYTAEFEEMFVDQRFGADSPPGTPPGEVEIDGVMVQVLFSPDDGVAARLEALLRGAQHSIHFLAFSFTSDLLAEALRDQARAGVEVLGVMDADQARSNTGTEFESFQNAGLAVRGDGAEGQMHHKFLVIDEQTVVTGSYNFSNSAERRNDENLIVLKDPRMAAVFIGEFWRIFAAAGP